MRPPPRVAALAAGVIACLAPSVSSALGSGPRALSLVVLDSEPKEGRARPGPDELAESKRQVDEHPDDRAKRLTLVRDLLAVKDLDGALVQAKAWRAKDAYNLVAVRALGDVLMDRGEKD